MKDQFISDQSKCWPPQWKRHMMDYGPTVKCSMHQIFIDENQLCLNLGV